MNEEVDEAHSEVKVKNEVKVELESEDATVSEGSELSLINNY